MDQPQTDHEETGPEEQPPEEQPPEEQPPEEQPPEDQPGEPGAEGGSDSPAADRLPGMPSDDDSPLGDTDQHSAD
jgi:hypothetical protein